jgi:hypothetical protein
MLESVKNALHSVKAVRMMINVIDVLSQKYYQMEDVYLFVRMDIIIKMEYAKNATTRDVKLAH